MLDSNNNILSYSDYLTDGRFQEDFPDHVQVARVRHLTFLVAIKFPHARARNLSSEIRFLKELRWKESPLNHVVPFLGTYEAHEGTCIVLPRLVSLTKLAVSTYIHAESKHAKFLLLARQLVDAVIYLHGNGIAHLDLKPANIVLDPIAIFLYLIDFGSSEMYYTTGYKINKRRGTRGYADPEIDLDDRRKPQRMYDPFKADLFSLGLVIRDIAEYTGCPDPDFMEFAKLLTDADPNRRPFLHDFINDAAKPDFWKLNRLFYSIKIGVGKVQVADIANAGTETS